MKKAAYGFGGFVVLLVAAALIVPSLVNWNSYKAEIAAEAQKATGRTLEIAGDLELGILPTPHVRVSDVRFANVSGSTAPHMATLKEFRASVKLLPLLTGSVEVASVELIEPVIELEKRADGSGNWEVSPPVKAGAGSGTKEAGPSESGKSDPQAFSLDRLRIEQGTVVYRDAAAGTVQRLENLEADLLAGSLQGPFTVKGGVRMMGVSLTIEGRVGRFAEKSAVPFDIAFGTPQTLTRINLKGNVTDIETEPVLSATLDGRGDNLGALVGALSAQQAPAILGQRFSIAALIKGSVDHVNVNDIGISLGQSKIEGDVKVRLDGPVQVDASLRSKTVNVDEWLTVAAKPSAPAAPASVSGPGATTPADGSKAVADEKTLSGGLPNNVQVNFALDISQAILRKGSVRDIRVQAGLVDGALILNTFTATLPGSSRVNASGRITAPQGVMMFKGKTSFQTASLRSVLRWLEMDIAGLPADRLRRFAFSSDMVGTARQVQITNIEGQLDASRMSGGVTVALRERPAFGASVSIDQLNIDDYQIKPANAQKPGAGGVAQPNEGEVAAPVTAELSSPGPLAALNEFDANLQLRIENVNYQKTAIRGVRVDGSLLNGKLTLSDASIRNLAGTRIRLAGTVSGQEGIPRFNGTVSAASNNLTGLLRVAGIESSVSPRRLGKMRLTAKTKVTAERVTLDADLQLAEARTRLTGSIDDLPGTPLFDISLDSRHPEMARLAALFSDGRPGPRAGPLTVKANVKGNMTALDVAATTGMNGGSLKIAGKVNALLTTPRLDLGVDLNQPDFVKFVRMFDPGYTPSKRRLGSLKLTAKLQGTDRDLSIRNLTGNVGPTMISGSGTYVEKSPRPAVKLALKSSVITLSDYLEASSQLSRPSKSATGQSAAGRQPASQPGSRWSRETIDTGALGLVDADIDLGADALLYKSYRVNQPKILATLKNRILDIRQITGKMFEGSFEMKARMDMRKTPDVQSTIKVVNARVDNAFFAGESFDVEAGNLSHDLTIRSRGQSQYDMIRRLNGNGQLTVTDGVVRGFDLRALTRVLRGADLANLLNLMPAAIASIGKTRTTKFSSLEGTIQIANGVVSTRDALLMSDGGDISAAGTVNLPGWDMKMIADIRPRKVREIPNLRVTLTGPPDQPNARFNFDELTKDSITRGIGGLLKKVLPGVDSRSNPSSGSRSQSQQQHRNLDPTQELIKNIFRGLGR